MDDHRTISGTEIGGRAGDTLGAQATNRQPTSQPVRAHQMHQDFTRARDRLHGQIQRLRLLRERLIEAVPTSEGQSGGHVSRVRVDGVLGVLHRDIESMGDDLDAIDGVLNDLERL